MRILLSVFFIAGSAALLAQVHQPDRFEIELTPYEDEYNVLSAEEEGVLVYREMSEFQSGSQKWKFTMLDTTLTEQWEKEYFLDRDHIYKGYDYDENNFYFLFRITERGSHDLMLIQMNASTGDTLNYRIKNLVPLRLEAFEMANGAAIIGGYFNEDPVVMYYGLESKKTKVLPGIYGNKTELVQVKIEKDIIKVLVTERTFDKRNTLAIKTYDLQGNYLDNYVFKPEEDTGLIFGRVAEINNEGSLICGTYGARKSDYSRGLFIAQHKKDEGQVMQYFNFADLDNFFAYMKAKRQERVANKITRKKVKGKKVKFNYRLLVHEIIESEDSYIMLGEAFYIKYNNSQSFSRYNVGTNYYGNGPNYNTMTFAGYRYTHAVVIGFDKKGNKLWDNSFQIEDVLTYSLDQYVHADVIDDKVILLYLYNNEIRTKIISGSDVLEGKLYDEVKMSFADDYVNKNNYSNIGGLEKWYGHNFFAYGVQKIKNLRDSGVKLNRKVFYINKISYDGVTPDAVEISKLSEGEVKIP